MINREGENGENILKFILGVNLYVCVLLVQLAWLWLSRCL